MKKKIFNAIAVLVFTGLASISVQANSSQDEFLKIMANGLNERWDVAFEDESDMTTDEFVEYRMTLVDAEYNNLIEFKDNEFENKKFSLLARAYIEGVEIQKNALQYYENLRPVYDVEWNAGYNIRAIAICDMYDYYGLDISEDKIDEFRSSVDNMYTYEVIDTSVSDLNQGSVRQNDLKVIAAEVDSIEYGWCNFHFVIENCSDESIHTVSLNISLLDDNGNIVSTTYPQIPSTIKPGQSAAIDTCIEEGKAYSAVVDGYSYYNGNNEYISGQIGECEELVLTKDSMSTESKYSIAVNKFNNGYLSEARELFQAIIDDETISDKMDTQDYLDVLPIYILANNYLYELANKLNDPMSLTLYGAQYTDQSLSGNEVFMFEYTGTNKMGGTVKGQAAFIDGTFNDASNDDILVSAAGKTVFIADWDSDTSIKLDTKVLMNSIFK